MMFWGTRARQPIERIRTPSPSAGFPVGHAMACRPIIQGGSVRTRAAADRGRLPAEAVEWRQCQDAPAERTGGAKVLQCAAGWSKFF